MVSNEWLSQRGWQGRNTESVADIAVEALLSVKLTSVCWSVCVCLQIEWSAVSTINREAVNYTIVLSLQPLLCGRWQLLILAHGWSLWILSLSLSLSHAHTHTHSHTLMHTCALINWPAPVGLMKQPLFLLIWNRRRSLLIWPHLQSETEVAVSRVCSETVTPHRTRKLCG